MTDKIRKHIANTIESGYNIRKEVIFISIRNVRRSRGLTQQELAKMLGVSQGAVGQWEIGYCFPHGKLIVRMSEILSCTTDELMHGNGERKLED